MVDHTTEVERIVRDQPAEKRGGVKRVETRSSGDIVVKANSLHHSVIDALADEGYSLQWVRHTGEIVVSVPHTPVEDFYEEVATSREHTVIDVRDDELHVSPTSGGWWNEEEFDAIRESDVFYVKNVDAEKTVIVGYDYDD